MTEIKSGKEKNYIMALDAGTTSSRCIIFDKACNVVSIAQKEFTQIYPQPGWVEHNADEIWSTQISVAVEALAKAELKAENIAALGITNQRETTIVWDRKTGDPVYNAIVWQCRRTAGFCDTLADKKEMIRKKTGLILDPYFSATKIRWILDNVEGTRDRAERGELCFGTVETWLLYKLTGGKVHKTDVSNASRTMLFNINTLKWDDELIELLDIPKSMLPEVVSNSELYGMTETEFFSTPIPVTGMAGDQQSALFGQTCFEAGEAKNTYGTGCFLLMNAGEKPVDTDSGLVSTVAWSVGGKCSYALEGSVFMGGAVLKWLKEEMGLIESARAADPIVEQVEDTNGCYLVPAFTGLGAPYWDPYARGTIVGLTRGTNKNHIIKAAYDSIAYQVEDVLQVMSLTSGRKVSNLKVDGGVSNSAYLMQFQADLSDVNVQKPQCTETTAMGAAYLAGLAVGFWDSMDEIKKMQSMGREFAPNMSEEKRAELKAGWEKAVSRSRSWAL